MKKTYILTTIVIFALAVAGCKKGFLDQSINPNQPSTASPQNILSGALQASTTTTAGGTYLTQGVWMGYFAPSGSYVPSTLTETYNFTNTSFNFFGTYYNNLANYNVLILTGISNPAYANFQAIGKIMTAYDYEMLVDNYSDVPYSQALNSSKYLFPVYDSGQSIYNDLEVQLDAAIALINGPGAGGINPGTSDIYFKGNMTGWKKFANFLKLRIAIRQSNIVANKAALVTELTKTAGEGYLDDATFVSAQPGYLASDANGGQQAPFYKNWGVSAAGGLEPDFLQDVANSFYINMLVGYNDTLRLKQAYLPTLLKTEPAGKVPPDNVSHIIGNTLGADATNTTNSNTSFIGSGLAQGPTMAQPIVQGSEACFLLSEAVLEGYVVGPASGVGSAQDYYQRGITASFVQLNVPNAAAAAATYYNQPIVDVNWTASSTAPAPGGLAGVNGSAPAGTALLRAIMTQKYISLIGFGFFEAYNEYRRTGLPNLQGARSANPGALGTGAAPNRGFFPSTEFQTNTAAVSAEPVINPFTSLIFWARNINP